MRFRSATVFLHQVVDVGVVGLGESGAFDDQQVFGVQLRAVREVVGASDHRVIHHEHLVVHEVVDAVRAVGGRVLAGQPRLTNDLLDRLDLPMVVRDILSLVEHRLHLRAVIDAGDFHSPVAQLGGEG